MAYGIGFPVNNTPAPNGDKVKQAIEKLILEFVKIYGDLSAMEAELNKDPEQSSYLSITKLLDRIEEEINNAMTAEALINKINSNEDTDLRIAGQQLTLNGDTNFESPENFLVNLLTAATLDNSSVLGIADEAKWGTQGYVRIPFTGGLILQWDQVTVGDRSKATFDLPIPFPHMGLFALATPYTDAYTDTSSAFFSAFFPSLDKISITVGHFRSRPVNYLAVGR